MEEGGVGFEPLVSKMSRTSESACSRSDCGASQ